MKQAHYCTIQCTCIIIHIHTVQSVCIWTTKQKTCNQYFSKAWFALACVADETKPRYSPSANQRPKACSAPRVLPVLSIIGSNWLLHMAVPSCTVIGRVDVVEPWLRSRWIPDMQNKRRRSRNYLERYLNAKVLLKRCSEYPGPRGFSWYFTAWESCERAAKRLTRFAKRREIR